MKMIKLFLQKLFYVMFLRSKASIFKNDSFKKRYVSVVSKLKVFIS